MCEVAYTCIVACMNTLLFTPALYLLLVSVPLLVVDIRSRRLPNKILLPVFPVWLISSIYYAVVSGDWLSSVVLPLAIGIPVSIILLVMNYKGSLGMGDVKLLGVLAMFVLPPETASYKIFLFTVALTATVHAIFLSRGDLRRSLQIPLAPAILCGTIAALILKKVRISLVDLSEYLHALVNCR